MIGLPNVGDRVHVWPAPGRHNVQDGSRTLDAGGRFLPPEGRDVVWTHYHLEQYSAGDLLLHSPAPTAPALPAKTSESEKG